MQCNVGCGSSIYWTCELFAIAIVLAAGLVYYRDVCTVAPSNSCLNFKVYRPYYLMLNRKSFADTSGCNNDDDDDAAAAHGGTSFRAVKRRE